jgi:hypothetical protein
MNGSLTGASLPAIGPRILSVKRDADAAQYILRCEPAEFEQLLTVEGAKVIESGPLSLNEIFLELCRTSESTEEEMARV